jgi:uncharacterized protein (TIRG00374 family)
VYAHLSDIKPVFREKLERDKMLAKQSKELGTICIDVPVALDLKKCETRDFDRSRVVKLFPVKWHSRLTGLIDRFIDGFKIISHQRHMYYLVFLSILIWVIDAVAMYVLFFAFDIELPLSAAFVLMTTIIIGIAIPAAPGFIGNWHFFCVL